MTREWKVTLYRPYTSEEVVETFTEESLMNSYVKENEAYVVNIEEVVINNLTESLNLGSGKTRYQVNVNVMYDDSWYCSQVDDQWNYLVFASSKKEAEELAMKLAEVDLSKKNDGRYLELVDSTCNVVYDNSESYPTWKKVK